MSDTSRRWWVVALGMLVLIVPHYLIISREQLLTEGRVVLLRLAPVDPRSLMQGDYMALRFSVADELQKEVGRSKQTDGLAVLYLGDDSVAKFRRVDDGRGLAADEIHMRFRVRRGRVRLATNAFFFAEGTDYEYANASFGEFRVATDGEAILTHLRGEGLERLGQHVR